MGEQNAHKEAFAMPEDRKDQQQDRDIQDMKIQLARHEVQINNLESNLKEQSGVLKDIQTELKQLVDSLGNRPSWLIAWILGGLLTAVGTLGMFIITKL
jgi:uncharacterized coiled-coil protein SlyX